MGAQRTYFDEVMDFNVAKAIVKDKGWEGFMEHFQDRYPERRLYACSQFWYNDKHYICKIRGTRGDIIIGWNGVHV